MRSGVGSASQLSQHRTRNELHCAFSSQVMIFLRHLVFLEKSMARLSDSALPSQLELMSPTVLMAQPSDSPVEDESALEGLLYPIVIIKREGDICFMNGAARRLLSEGLDLRLAAFVRGHQQGMGPTTQVHFKLQNGQDLILKVGLGEIVWLGEKAIQVSIWNVTPYLAIIQKLRKERARSLAASLEQTRQQADEEASQRQQAQADLEKARAAASASEQIQSKLRQELEALRRDREQLSADREGESSQVTELLEKNARLNQDLADRAARENELAQAREQLQVGAEVREKLSARIETLESELSDATAQREELQRQVAQQVSGDGSARDEIKAEIAKRQSLEKEIATLRHDLASAKLTRSKSAMVFKAQEDQDQDLVVALARARQEVVAATRFGKTQQDVAAQAEGEVVSLKYELKCLKHESAKKIKGLEDETRSRDDALARGREDLAVAAKLAKVQEDKLAKAEADAASLAQELERVKSESAKTTETLNGGSADHADALARAREELAEAARLAKVQEDKLAKAEADAASLAQEMQKVKSESAKTIATLNGGSASRADALARTCEELAVAARLAKVQQDKAAKAEADAASLAQELQKVKSESANTIETLKGESASHADALARAREELAEAARLAKVQQDKAAKAEADAAFIMKTEPAKRESLEKVITALRQDLAGSEQARSESAETFETLKNETRSHADALARAREELAEAASLAKAQQDKAAKAEADAVSLAHELQKVKSESANTIEMLKGESASHADELARAREELTQAVTLARVQQEKAARAEAEAASIASQLRQAKSEVAERIETLEGKVRGASDELALAREELAEVAELAKVQQDKVAKAEAGAAFIMEAGAAKRQSLEKVIAALRQDLAISEQARSESAQTFETLKNEIRSHADALALAREELAEVDELAKVQQDKVAKAEAGAASLAHELQRVNSESAKTIETLKLESASRADALARAREEQTEAAQFAKAQQDKAAEAEKQAASAARELELEVSNSAKARHAWEVERAGFVSRGGFAGAIEKVRQQLETETSRRTQVEADLEKAHADASASEQIHSKLRQELEALRRALGQSRARGEEESSQAAELHKEN